MLPKTSARVGLAVFSLALSGMGILRFMVSSCSAAGVGVKAFDRGHHSLCAKPEVGLHCSKDSQPSEMH